MVANLNISIDDLPAGRKFNTVEYGTFHRCSNGTRNVNLDSKNPRKSTVNI